MPCGKQDAQVNCRFGPGCSTGYTLRGQGRHSTFPWGHKQKALTTKVVMRHSELEQAEPTAAARASPVSPQQGPSDTLESPLPLQLKGLEHRIYTGAGDMENTKESMHTS